MRSAPPLATRLVATGLAFLALAMGSIALTLWVTWQMEGGAAAVNEAGRLRMMSYRMAFELAGGRREALPRHAAQFDATLELLREGDPSRPLAVPATEEARRKLAQVHARWDTLKPELLQGTSPPPQEVNALVETIDGLVGSIERQLSGLNAMLRGFELAMVALAVVGALALLYTSHVLVLEPLRRLGNAMAALRGGDLGARVPQEASAEFRELGEGFAAMAQRLAEHYATLEETVSAKTAALQAERERLAALYEVSSFLAGAESLDEMARGFVARVRGIARADAAALRWSDVDNRRYMMLAQEGLPPAFAAEEECLPTGECLCGQPPAVARTQVIPIRSSQPTRHHCARAGYETLVTVPLRLQHRIHGELTLFFRRTVPSEATDTSLLEVLASHFAGGMEGLRAAAAEKEAAVSTERTLIAQELHDSIAQSLAFLKIQLQLLRGALRRGEQPAIEASVRDIEAGVQESTSDVRELLVHFRTRADSEDIEPALRTTLRKFQHQTGLKAALTLQGHGIALPADVQVQVLHIVQEALSNVRKHAHATEVSLSVSGSPQWQFEVRDDGVGFDTDASRQDTQVGLRIMRERAARIGAQVSLRSAPGEGTCVTLSLPRENRREEERVEAADPIAGHR